ncbi:MAG: nucleotidyltransferase family protein [Caldilineaceae bacterium]|nr:nucleotidyltransferase family protein [Caldilineaceae bacterium]
MRANSRELPSKSALAPQPKPHGPDPQQQLLLRAGLLSGEAGRAAWRAWRPQADLDRLPIGGFDLLPLLAHNLQQQGITDSLLDKCRGIYRRTWTQNQLSLQQVGQVIELLQTAAITPLLQGDSTLVLSAYPTLGLRAIHQIQLVTATAQAATVPRLLAQAGWYPQPSKEHWLRHWLGSNAPQLFRQPASPLRLTWQNCPGPSHTRGQHTVSLRLGDRMTEHVDATELFLTVCQQGIATLWQRGAVQWVADAWMVLHAAAPTIDWERILVRIRTQATQVRMAAALTGLQQWVDAPIPPQFLEGVLALPYHPFEAYERQLLGRFSPKVGRALLLWTDIQRQKRGQ